MLNKSPSLSESLQVSVKGFYDDCFMDKESFTSRYIYISPGDIHITRIKMDLKIIGVFIICCHYIANKHHKYSMNAYYWPRTHYCVYSLLLYVCLLLLFKYKSFRSRKLYFIKSLFINLCKWHICTHLSQWQHWM